MEGLDNHIFKFMGRSDVNKKLTRTLNMTGAKNDVYMVNAWGRGTPLPETDNDPDRRFGVEVVFISSAGARDVHYTNFSSDLLDWQFLSDVYVAKHAYTKVEVSYTYCHQANTAYFDGLSLFREEFGQTYTYDEDNNIVSVEDNQKNRQEFEYNSSNDMTGVTDAKGNDFTYTYDNKHRVTQGVSAEGVKYKYVYDDTTGNVTKSGVFDPSNTARGLWMTRGMTSDKNHVASMTDPEGNTVSYAWNLNKDLLTSMTDGKGNSTSYTYDTLGRLTGVSLSGISNGYTYENDRLKTITHNGFSYGFTYDVFVNTTAASIAGSNVISYQYEAGNGNLTKTTYANGAYIRYTYDAQDRVTDTFYKDSASGTEAALNSYVYDKQGNLAEVTNHPTGKTYMLSYDFLDRLMRVRDDQGNIYEYTYDANNNMTFLKYVGGGISLSTAYEYDKDGREVVTRGASRTRTTAYDVLGRITGQTWGTATPVTAAYTYPDNGNQCRVRPSKLVIAGTTYEYTYDANGNITSIAETVSGVKKTERYQYDTRNQLIREDSEKQSKSFVYTYDVGGNLTSIKEYAHTTGTLGSVLKTTAGTYPTSGWKDRLTAWGGKNITYDAVGNMLTKGSTAFTWTQGRKLASVSNGKSIQYAYDHTGNRVKKTVNGTVTEYHLAGNLILSETTGSSTQSYRYDSSGKLFSATIGGNIYFYLHNLQGDVIGLVNASGTKVVEYTYDSWGNVLSITGSLKDTVGVQNPFRYRGYYYDAETGLYYLQSRYYDAEIRRFISADSFDVLRVQKDHYDKNLYTYCDNNPIIRLDINGQVWTVALLIVSTFAKKAVISKIVDVVLGAAINIASTYIAAKVTGQEYTGRDAFWAGVSGGIAGGGGTTAAAIVSGGYAGYVALESGAGIGGVVVNGLASGLATATFGSAGNYGGKSVSHAANAMLGTTVGTGGNLIAGAANATVTNMGKVNSSKDNVSGYRFIGYKYQYNGKTGAKMLMKRYVWNNTGKEFYVLV